MLTEDQYAAIRTATQRVLQESYSNSAIFEERLIAYIKEKEEQPALAGLICACNPACTNTVGDS